MECRKKIAQARRFRIKVSLSLSVSSEKSTSLTSLLTLSSNLSFEPSPVCYNYTVNVPYLLFIVDEMILTGENPFRGLLEGVGPENRYFLGPEMPTSEGSAIPGHHPSPPHLYTAPERLLRYRFLTRWSHQISPKHNSTVYVPTGT